jgi:hypothetical protein
VQLNPLFNTTSTRTPGGRGCTENPVRDVAALVGGERGVPGALSNAGMTGQEGRPYVVLV